MLPDDARRFGILQDPLFDQNTRPPRSQFFRRLKNSPNGSSETGALLVQYLNRSEQTGRVYVVATGVHDSIAFTFIGNLVLLLNRECVDVAAQGEDFITGQFPFDVDYDSIFRPAGFVVDAPAGERSTDEFSGFHFLIRQLGVRVEVTTESDDLGSDRCCGGSNDIRVHDGVILVRRVAIAPVRRFDTVCIPQNRIRGELQPHSGQKPRNRSKVLYH